MELYYAILHLLSFLILSLGCDVQVSVLQGKLSVGRGVGLASTAGAATVKKILNPFAESVNTIFAGEKGIISLIDRFEKKHAFFLTKLKHVKKLFIVDFYRWMCHQLFYFVFDIKNLMDEIDNLMKISQNHPIIIDEPLFVLHHVYFIAQKIFLSYNLTSLFSLQI